jgi:hypothetical protein
MLPTFIATHHAVGGPDGGDPSTAESSEADALRVRCEKVHARLAAQRKAARQTRRKMKLTPAMQKALNTRNAEVRARNAMRNKVWATTAAAEAKSNKDEGKVCLLPILLHL